MRRRKGLMYKIIIKVALTAAAVFIMTHHEAWANNEITYHDENHVKDQAP